MLVEFPAVGGTVAVATAGVAGTAEGVTAPGVLGAPGVAGTLEVLVATAEGVTAVKEGPALEEFPTVGRADEVIACVAGPTLLVIFAGAVALVVLLAIEGFKLKLIYTS